MKKKKELVKERLFRESCTAGSIVRGSGVCEERTKNERLGWQREEYWDYSACLCKECFANEIRWGTVDENVSPWVFQHHAFHSKRHFRNDRQYPRIQGKMSCLSVFHATRVFLHRFTIPHYENVNRGWLLCARNEKIVAMKNFGNTPAWSSFIKRF